MATKKKNWYSNGDLVVIVLMALGAALAVAVEEVTKRYLNKSRRKRGGRKPKPKTT